MKAKANNKLILYYLFFLILDIKLVVQAIYIFTYKHRQHSQFKNAVALTFQAI